MLKFRWADGVLANQGGAGANDQHPREIAAPVPAGKLPVVTPADEAPQMADRTIGVTAAVLSEPSEWKVVGDELVQRQRTSPAFAFMGDRSWKDYDVSVECLAAGGEGNFSVSVRATAPPKDDRYEFLIGGWGNRYHSIRSIKGGIRPGASESKAANIRLRDWYRVRIEVRGNRARCFLNDDEWFDRQDVRFPAGGITLGCYKTEAHFRHLRVTAPNGAILWSGLPLISSVATAQGATATNNVPLPIIVATREAARPAAARRTANGRRPIRCCAIPRHQEAWAKHLGVPVEQTNSIGMKLVLIPPGLF